MGQHWVARSCFMRYLALVKKKVSSLPDGNQSRIVSQA